MNETLLNNLRALADSTKHRLPRRWQGKPQATALVRKELRSQAKEACEVAP